MNRTPPTLDSVLRQARRLPVAARRKLAAKLLDTGDGDFETIAVPMRRFAGTTQRRIQDLMDRNTEGKLNTGERAELEVLVGRYEKLMLINSEALLKATHPDLFNALGNLNQKRLDRAVRKKLQSKGHLGLR